MTCKNCEKKMVIENPAYVEIYIKGSASAYTYDSVVYLECTPDWVHVVYLDDDMVTMRSDIFPHTEIASIFSRANNQNLKAVINNARKGSYML